MPPPIPLSNVAALDTEQGAVARKNAIEQLEELRKRILSGETVRFGTIEFRRGGDYSTQFSDGIDKLRSAALLIELGMRMLGFENTDPILEEKKP